jgi:hypothetical protein
MRIKQEILDQINKGPLANKIKGSIIIENDKHPGSVQRWIDNNDEILTTAKNLSIICQHLDVDQSEILEDEKAAA